MVDQQQLLDLLEYLLSKYNTSFVGTVSSAGTGKTLYVDIGGTLIQATSLNVDAPGEVAVIADSSGNFYCFKVGGVNLKRNRVITSRKFKYIEKDITELDVAILYAIKEEKSYAVDFINPTWEIQTRPIEENNFNEFQYICVPVAEGDRGEYPNSNTCLQFAQNYWQDQVEEIELDYQNQLAQYEQRMVLHEQDLQFLPSSISSYYTATSGSPVDSPSVTIEPLLVTSRDGQVITVVADTRYSSAQAYPDGSGGFVFGIPLFILNIMGDIRQRKSRILDVEEGYVVPPTRDPNPPLPEAIEPSKTAFSIYCKTTLKAEPVKLIEINEKEFFEATLVASKNNIVPILKLGRAKLNELQTDGMGGSCGGGEPSSYWTVTDLESWYKLQFFDQLPQNNSSSTVYPSYPSLSQFLSENYQSWRFSSLSLYPSISGNVCFLGQQYLSISNYKDRYKSIINYQTKTNVNTKLLEAELKNLENNGITYRIDTEDVSPSVIEVLNPILVNLKLLSSKPENNICKKRVLKSVPVQFNLPSGTVFCLVKPYIK